MVVRAAPLGLSLQELHGRLLQSLEQMGYSIAYAGPPIRAVKGAKRVQDDVLLAGLVKSLWDSSERTVISLDIKHTVIVSTIDEQVRFEFRVGQSFIELSLLEHRDKMAFERIADEAIKQAATDFQPMPQTRMNPVLKARITRWIGLYHEVSGAGSFVAVSTFLFMFPVLIEFAGSIAGWTTHWVIEGYGEVRLPIAFQYNPKIWDMQLLVNTACFCILVVLGLLLEARIAGALHQLGKSLDAKQNSLDSSYPLRDVLRQLDMRPIHWTSARLALALIGGLTLAASIPLSTSNYRVLSIAGLFAGTTLVAYSCNLAGYGRRKKGRVGRVLSFLWYYAALAWMLYWYDSYIASWTINGMEIRDIWFLAGYGGGVALLMFYFAYWEVREHSKDVYDVLVGKASRERLNLGVRSCLTLAFYALALVVLRVPLPLPSVNSPSEVTIIMYGGLEDFIGNAETLFLGVFSILPSAVLAIAFVRYLWKRQFHIHIGRGSAVRAFAFEAWGFFMDKGKELAIYVVGLVLLWIAAHGAPPSVAGLPPFLYLAAAIIELLAIFLVAARYYTLSRRLDASVGVQDFRAGCIRQSKLS